VLARGFEHLSFTTHEDMPMKSTPVNDAWPTRDSKGDARGLPGYPKAPDSASTGAAGGKATTPDGAQKAEREQRAEDENLAAD
jgi:hypothetical protein